MATVYTGAAQVLDTDFRYVKWVGKTKGGKPVQIELENAFCRSNIDWKFEEKNDTTAEVEFEGAYLDEKLAAGDLTEPSKMVALTRGGGSFVVEREFREINADGDPGLVKGRIAKEAGRPKLKLVALQWLTKVSDLYSCVTTATT